jgi:hypothetical protein
MPLGIDSKRPDVISGLYVYTGRKNFKEKRVAALMEFTFFYTDYPLT